MTERMREVAIFAHAAFPVDVEATLLEEAVSGFDGADVRVLRYWQKLEQACRREA
jgi:hypothetical protein